MGRDKNGHDEEFDDEIEQTNTCEKIITATKDYVRIKSIRRAIGFVCLIWLVYNQQINVQNFQQMMFLLNTTDILNGVDR